MWVLWLAFLVLILALLALDLGVFHKEAHVESIREAAGWSVFWVALGLSFSGVIYLVYEQHWLGATLFEGADHHAVDGSEAAVQYVTGYLLEKSLSIDNLFVIALIFTSFRVPRQHQHRVLFWGIVGALVFRGAMIFGGIWLVNRFVWIFYFFGAYLVYAGIKIFLHKESTDVDPREHLAVRFVRRLLPVAKGPHEGHFTRLENGRRAITELLVVLLVIELTDVMFAVDSVPAVLAITTDPFIVVTSNVFAILGLRALYFVLAGMLNSFRYLKLTLGVLLAYIGVKLMLHSVFKIPTLVSLGVILGLVTIGVVASIVFPSGREGDGDGSAE
jgi:tellurite resistance protein TerC